MFLSGTEGNDLYSKLDVRSTQRGSKEVTENLFKDLIESLLLHIRKYVLRSLTTWEIGEETNN